REFDIRAKKIAIRQKEDALLTAKQTFGDHFIYAPFIGKIAEVNIKRGEAVSASTNIATLITDQRLAVIALNEVDIAQVEIGQKATISFDAVEDITVTGEAVEIDAIGTVSQGVVSYDVTISFDVQDERIKPGMSLSADIITNAKQGVLLVPNAAVKAQGSAMYVEVLQNNQPYRQTVEIGLSNDTQTEIISGLTEGDEVITQTITTSGAEAPTPTRGTNSLFPTGRGGGGGFRGGGFGGDH
ncbi:efflux RND transporter periplasmic adaptor subunit, partial [Patescibacteria group bacterium]|nr:efflux RND transporter periplasmic adaptor subunit [Patescibacteria group bacterium]